MIDISMIEKLKKKLDTLKKSRAAVDIEIAKKEALLNDLSEKLRAEYGVSTLEDGKEALASLNARAKELEAEIIGKMAEAEKLIGEMP